MPIARRLLTAFLIALLASLSVAGTGVSATSRPSAKPVFVDTDIGVDDAVAIAYLLRERAVNVIGFTTVNGNTPVVQATNNLLTLLDTMELSKPVTMGAAAPLELPASKVGAFVHGPSGLWFNQVPHDLSNIPTDAPAAIAAAARANPGMTLLTLGPLTNIAQAVQRFPEDMATVKVVALGGARGPGNRTPVAETNIYIDPHAAEIVTTSGLDLTLIPIDAFNQVKVDSVEFPEKLTRKGGALGAFLASALVPYFNSLNGGAGGPVQLPDVAAAIYVARPQLGTPTTGFVFVVTDDGKTRGQTIMTVDANAKVGLVTTDAELSEWAERAFTDPNFNLFVEIGMVLAQYPDNAQIVLDVREGMMVTLLKDRLL
jgi:purine nucleosidase